MATLARLFDFAPGAPIVSGDVDSEFNQLVNILNGTSTSKNAIIKYSDAATPPLKLDQLGAGKIQEWAQTGIVLASVENSGDIKVKHDNSSFVLENAANTRRGGIFQSGDGMNIVNFIAGVALLGFDLTTNVGTFNQIPILPASNPTTANQAVRKQFIDDKTTAFSASFFYATIPAAVETTESVPRFICPEGTSVTITKLKIVRAGGTHTGATVSTWTIKRRNAAGTLQTDVGTISLNDTNATIDNLYENDITDVPLTAGDQIYALLTTRTGTPTETLVTVGFIGTQKLT